MSLCDWLGLIDDMEFEFRQRFAHSDVDVQYYKIRVYSDRKLTGVL